MAHQIYSIGDSLTYPGPDGSYVAPLVTLLGSSWNINNKGVDYNTTTQMLARFQTDILTPSDGEYVIIWGGINDVLNTSDSAETIEGHLEDMYEMAHNQGLKVVAVTISPCNALNSSQNNILAAVNSWIMNTVPATYVDYRIDAHEVLEDPENPNCLLPAYDDGSHLHLSSAGYSAIADAIYAGVTWTINDPPTEIDWTPCNETWRRINNNKLAIPADANIKYQKGDKIRFNQHGIIKYMFIIGTTLTTISVTGGSTYVIEDTVDYPITNNYYSRSEDPLGFPDCFPWIPTFSGSGQMTYTNVTVTTAKFWLKGKCCKILIQCDGVIGGTPDTFVQFSLPITPNSTSRTPCLKYNATNYEIAWIIVNGIEGGVQVGNANNWTTGSTKIFMAEFFYDI